VWHVQLIAGAVATFSTHAQVTQVLELYPFLKISASANRDISVMALEQALVRVPYAPPEIIALEATVIFLSAAQLMHCQRSVSCSEH